jgi:hypothetical protein
LNYNSPRSRQAHPCNLRFNSLRCPADSPRQRHSPALGNPKPQRPNPNQGSKLKGQTSQSSFAERASSSISLLASAQGLSNRNDHAALPERARSRARPGSRGRAPAFVPQLRDYGSAGEQKRFLTPSPHRSGLISFIRVIRVIRGQSIAPRFANSNITFLSSDLKSLSFFPRFNNSGELHAEKKYKKY